MIPPLRGVLYTLSSDPYWLVAVQMLDGVGAGVFGALFPVIVKDLTQGTGRFNVSLGALSTAFGLGAALSSSLAGFVVQWAGYNAAFLTLAGVAAVALGLLWVAMPETQANYPCTAIQLLPDICDNARQIPTCTHFSAQRLGLKP